MVQVGTIEYHATVTGAGEARAEADDVTGSFTQMGTQAESAAGATGFLGAVLGSTSDDLEETSDQAEDTDTNFTLLAGTSWLVSGALSGLSTVLSALGFGSIASSVGGLASSLSGLTLSGVLGSVTGALSSFVGWLAAGSAGALAVAGAIGAVIGLFGVWILEITGVLDWIGQLGQQLSVSLPGWARDGINAVIGLFAGPLAVIGAFIVGFIEGGFDQAFARANQIISIFAGSFERTFNRIAGFFRGLWSGLTSFLSRTWADITAQVNQVWQGIQGTISGVWNDLEMGARQFVDDAVSFITGIPGRISSTISTIRTDFDNLVADIVGFFEGIGDTVVGAVQTAFNSTVPSSLSIPSVTIGGGEVAGQDIPSTTIGGGSIDLPQLQTGGIIEAAGIAQVHEGEAVIPEPIVDAAARGDTGGDGGGGDTNVDVGNITLELDGDFDPSDLSRRELRSLASDLADLIGDEIDTASGVR